MKKKQFTDYLKSFDFKTLFNELGWDHFDNKLPVAVQEELYHTTGIAQKKGFVVLQCPPKSNGKIPESSIRKQIEGRVTKNYYEHLIIYTDQAQAHQIWQLAIKEENKPRQVREVSWYSHQETDILFQRMKNLLFSLDEEDHITIVDVKQRISENFARNTEQVTKRFYDTFKKQHTGFLDFIKGIDDKLPNKENANKQWYASLMLNRLMFCYFIQKKGFLDQDMHYLQNKLKACAEQSGKGSFYSFYRSFLLELFHDGLGKPETKRNGKLPVDLGKIPYLNGGLFDVHELERQFQEIQISDEAFQKIFDFFDQWNWHLDNSIEATGRDINPDVIGYIFEKYINDRASMGAYYTKEDITDYIGKNTIIPFLFDETERLYKEAFKPGGELWQSLTTSGDTYIYDAVKKGVPASGALFDDLPEEVQTGFMPKLEQQIVEDETAPHLWEIRKAWNQKAPAEIALPTEIYRELIERRKRYAEVRQKIESGAITHINDFITYNLNIRQFAQDFIETTRDATFIRQFYKAIREVTILDPTCGSGAFLFAALTILEPLYEACITRMEQFVAEEPGRHKFFEETLKEIKSERHPNLQYFIYKSIILNNLYGVDIMHEAVEIAKLRLFLKLVATVDVNVRKPNFGLEPLPDIDFNIRAGNTLVGFATEQELLQTIQKKEPLFAQGILNDFKEEFELVSQAYARFQNSQVINDQGSDDFKQAKAELNRRLDTLNHKLNVYLATNYGIDAERKPKEFEKWLLSHQPFHWFAEYYQIIAGKGGFDVIIGNPPYVLYKDIKNTYVVQGFEAIDSGDLYAFVMEKSLHLSGNKSKIGLIIPMSCFSVEGFKNIQRLYKDLSKELFISNWSGDAHPSKLFEGVDKRLHIVISSRDFGKKCQIKITSYLKWYADERNNIFQIKPIYRELDISSEFFFENSFLKIKSEIENKILTKLKKGKSYNLLTRKLASKNVLYYTRKVSFFLQFLDFIPKVIDSNHTIREPSELKNIYFDKLEDRDLVLICLSSSLFYMFYIINSDCRNLNKREVVDFPIPKNPISHNKLSLLRKELMEDYNRNSFERSVTYKGKGLITVQYFNFRPSKPIIDQIDTVLAQHYGFTEEELDFIINYDIKYRMGKALFGEADTEEEDDSEE
jgi:hypothetical protein